MHLPPLSYLLRMLLGNEGHVTLLLQLKFAARPDSCLGVGGSCVRACVRMLQAFVCTCWRECVPGTQRKTWKFKAVQQVFLNKLYKRTKQSVLPSRRKIEGLIYQPCRHLASGQERDPMGKWLQMRKLSVQKEEALSPMRNSLRPLPWLSALSPKLLLCP